MKSITPLKRKIEVFLSRLKRAWAMLFGKEDLVITTKGSDLYRLIETQTQFINNKEFEDKISKLEHLLHYLAARIEVLTENQKETSELVIQQSSLFEEALNVATDITLEQQTNSSVAGHEVYETDDDDNRRPSKKQLLN